MDALVRPLLRQLATPGQAAIARVVSLTGFGLRESNDGAVVTVNGVDGSVLGGLIDDDLVGARRLGNERTLVTARVTDQEADAAGMVCGGRAVVLLSPADELPALFVSCVERAEPVALVARPDGTGTDLAVTRTQSDGTLGDPSLDEAAIAVARAMLDGGVSASEQHDVEGHGRILVGTVVPATRTLIVGSGRMADAIAAQCGLLGWTVDVDESLDVGLAFCRAAGPADAIVILSHDAELDTPLLAAALESPIGYLGAMGSRGTQTRRQRQLAELGHDPVAIARIHGPVGLDLGARSPAETAVAIVAEFLAVRSRRAPRSLTDTSGPING